jgi:hypothetical protein
MTHYVIRPTPKSSGYVYFVQAPGGGPVKIGFTTDHPKRRLKQLQSCSPVELTLRAMLRGTSKDKLALHKRFAANRLHSEWFAPHPDMPSICCDGEVTQPLPQEVEKPPKSLLDEVLKELT